ncbi:WG repeat-containing protein, partial [Myxococcota bacterium]|nr:WG repeat-containing protein [Myxococcota bacterium]
GRLLVAPSYTSIWWFSEGLVSVEKAGKYGFINHAGKEIVKPKYSFANAFFKGLAPVRDEKTYTWGYINHKGRMVIPLRFAIAERFNEHGVAVVTVRPKNWKRRGSLRGLQGLIDTRGKFVAPPKYDAIWYFTEGTAVFEINSKFQTSYCMKCRHTIKMSSQFGYLDAKGREIIKPIYSHAKPFRNGLAQVMLQYKRAYINKRGKTIYIQK